MRNKIYFVIIVVLALIAFFFFPKKGVNNTVQQVSPSPETVKEGKTSPVKNISMTAKKWEFDPSEIRVKMGERVRLTIKSIDVKHGFAIPEFDVKQDLEPQKDTIVEFVASKKGEFTFFCSVFCGEGHQDMKGKLIVE